MYKLLEENTAMTSNSKVPQTYWLYIRKANTLIILLTNN